MPDFSTILQAPEVRAIVQERILERAFHDALFPRILFRGESMPVEWPQNVGDTMVFTGTGLIKPSLKPLAPNADPVPSAFQLEQWEAQLQLYAGTIDTHMPTSNVAIANLLYRNTQQLGLMAGQTLNRIVRDKLYNAALSGHTVADGAQAAVTSLVVARLNGFTRSRNTSAPAGSPVRYDFVSGSNPLAITAAGTPVNVIGFTPLTAGDEIGPGTLLLDAAVTVANRDPVLTFDRTFLVRVGGASTIDGITSANLMTLSAMRGAVSRFWQQNVPEHPDGRFHAHFGPTSQAQVFSDPEWQRLLTALPDHYMYKQFAIGELLNTVVLRNSETPLGETIGGSTGTFPTPFSFDDPFAGELVNATSVPVQRVLFTAQGGIMEYWQDLSNLLTEAGATGRTGTFSISNNAIEVFTDRIQLIMRAPLDRLQQNVSSSWKFIGDWPIRTDATTGDAARYKRQVVIEHGS